MWNHVTTFTRFLPCFMCNWWSFWVLFPIPHFPWALWFSMHDFAQHDGFRENTNHVRTNCSDNHYPFEDEYIHGNQTYIFSHKGGSWQKSFSLEAMAPFSLGGRATAPALVLVVLPKRALQPWTSSQGEADLNQSHVAGAGPDGFKGNFVTFVGMAAGILANET